MAGQMSSWNNYVYGDCVTAEEAFAKATAAPQTSFRRDGGGLGNGAWLS